MEPAESIVLTLAPGAGYFLDTNVTATITLSDDDVTLQPPTAHPQTVSVQLNTATAISAYAQSARLAS